MTCRARNEVCGVWKPDQHIRAEDSVGGAVNEGFDGTQMSRHEECGRGCHVEVAVFKLRIHFGSKDNWEETHFAS